MRKKTIDETFKVYIFRVKFFRNQSRDPDLIGDVNYKK